MNVQTQQRSAVVGVFEHRGPALRAAEELRQAGFADEDIGVVVRHGDVSDNPDTPKGDTGTRMEEGAVGGVVAGGVAGGVLGALATLLIPGVGPVAAAGMLAATLGGAALGATTGGLLGALIGMGIPEEEAKTYEREFLAGRTLLTVRAGSRYSEAIGILRRHGARDTSAPSLVADSRLP